MKVFMIVTGDISNQSSIAAFSTRERAEWFVNTVEERENGICFHKTEMHIQGWELDTVKDDFGYYSLLMSDDREVLSKEFIVYGKPKLATLHVYTGDRGISLIGNGLTILDAEKAANNLLDMYLAASNKKAFIREQQELPHYES